MAIRNISIDFTAPIEDIIAGYVGEDNASLLVITPPTELNGLDLYNICILCGAEIWQSEQKPLENGVYSIPLPKVATEAPYIDLTLQGFDSEGTLMGRSPLISLNLKRNIRGEAAELEDEGILRQIAANTAARHTHDNKPVLDELGDDDGGLTYKGEPISGGGSTYTAGDGIKIAESEISLDINGISETEPWSSTLDDETLTPMLVKNGPTYAQRRVNWHTMWSSVWAKIKGTNSSRATTSALGLIKPDGTTITVSNDGTASSAQYDDTALSGRVTALETALLGVDTALDGLDESLGIGGGSDA